MPKGPDQIIKAHSIVSQEKVGAPQFWHTASFRHAWLKDTYLESEADGLDHRRKEVIFAVCFLETFLFEWVRDDILESNFEALAIFFPPNRTKGVIVKCKMVFDDLHKAGKVKEIPNWGAAHWGNFTKLVSIRDALVHAAISRPIQDDDGMGQGTVPEISAFLSLQAGWALNVTTKLAAEFYKAVPMDVPPLLLNPKLIS